MSVRVAALLCCLHGPPVAQVEDSVKALRRNVGRRSAADTAALSKLMAPRLHGDSRLGTVRTGPENLRDIASGTLHLTSIKYDSLNVRVTATSLCSPASRTTPAPCAGFPFPGRFAIRACSFGGTPLAGRGDATNSDAIGRLVKWRRRARLQRRQMHRVLIASELQGLLDPSQLTGLQITMAPFQRTHAQGGLVASLHC